MSNLFQFMQVSVLLLNLSFSDPVMLVFCQKLVVLWSAFIQCDESLQSFYFILNGLNIHFTYPTVTQSAQIHYFYSEICSGTSAGQSTVTPFIGSLAHGYLSICKQKNPDGRELTDFFGLRDFYRYVFTFWQLVLICGPLVVVVFSLFLFLKLKF